MFSFRITLIFCAHFLTLSAFSQSILHNYPPFEERETSRSLMPLALVSDAQGNDHSFTISAQESVIPLLLYSMNNEPAEAISDTTSLRGSVQAFVEEDGWLRIFYTEGLTRSVSTKRLRQGQLTEPSEVITQANTRVSEEILDTAVNPAQEYFSTFRSIAGDDFGPLHVVKYSDGLPAEERVITLADLGLGEGAVLEEVKMAAPKYGDEVYLLLSTVEAPSASSGSMLYTHQVRLVTYDFAVGSIIENRRLELSLTSLHTEGVFDKLSLGLLPGFFSVAEVFGGYRSSLGRVESTLFRVSDDGLQKDDYENEENFLPALSFVDRLGRMTVLTEAEQGNTKFSIFKCIDDAWRRSDSESFTNLSGSVLSIGPQGTPHLLGRLGETSGGLTALIRVRYRDATDLDGDGMSYLLEEAFASDPNDAQEARNICFQLANGTNPQIQCLGGLTPSRILT